MGIRLGVVTLLASLGLAGLVACGGSGGSGGDSGSPTAPPVSSVGVVSGSPAPVGPSGRSGGGAAAFCAKLQQAAVKLGDLGSSVTDPAKLKGALQDAISYFEELSSSAPSALKPVIENMINGMKTAQQALDDPSSADASALQKLGAKISAGAAKLANYTSEHCTG